MAGAALVTFVREPRASLAEIVADFPTLTEDDVRTVIAFAAASAEEDLPTRSIPAADARQTG